ncbi:MAG: primosomal protein N' [Chloroflexi bacterium]|nr:primosomal protein N' [Chloroflexota bacterium]
MSGTAEVAVFGGTGGPARTFTYGVPDGISLVPGHLVRVPLGSRTSAGVVIAIDVPAPAAGLRNADALADPTPVLRAHQLELARWIAKTYRCALADAVRAMVPPGVVRRARTPVRTRQRARRIPAELARSEDDAVRDAEATAAQGSALGSIERSLTAGGAPFLLHGVAGSGKTEGYLRAAATTLERGRGVIVLVPEIALTTQVVARFVARFGERVALLHSALSEGERLDEWRRVLAGEADVVVGSRSALFAPLAHPGLIVVDEEQEPSYKQESDPRYHAVDTALALGRIAGATVILGSATPRVTTWHAARGGELTPVELPVRVSDLALPPTTIVDLRLELKAGNRSTLSKALRLALERTIARGEQAILYLNRRGYATAVLCRDCGYVVECPACDIPFAYHAAGPPGRTTGDLLCHRCGRHGSVPERCPHCGGERIRHLGVGTQRVEDDVRAAVPSARILRLDRDAVRRKGAHAAAFELMRSGRAQVIVGTQMVAKGFDLPGVTLVGVVNADTLLNLPDHTAAERTFQLLTQVLGRSGRGSRGGRGILQTYLPEHYAVRAAAAHDYAAFAEAELAARKRFGHPPFGRLVLLQTAAKQQATVDRRADALAAALREAARGDAEVLGPAPAFAAKKAGTYRAQVVLRGARPEAALDRVEAGPRWSVDVDPVTLLG